MTKRTSISIKNNEYGEAMKKVRKEFKTKDWIDIGDGVLVKPFISEEDQKALTSIYLDEYFRDIGDSKYDYIRAENAFIASVLEMNTNLLLSEGDKILVPLDNVFEHWDFWEAVEHAIINYGDVRKKLYVTVEQRKEKIRIEASLPSVIRSVVERVANFLEDLGDTDFSDSKMANIKELLAEVNASPVLKDAIDIFKNKQAV